MKRHNWLLYLAAPLVIIGLVLVFSTNHGDTAYRAPAVSTPLRSDVTILVQTRLKQYGYTIKVDGIYGKQTTRIVSLWQRANGLQVDGFAGPATLKSLGPLFATATVPAVRTSPPSVPAPAAAVGTSSVEAIIREVWPDDLEDWAVKIATRESRLDPSARNACCFGLYQLFWNVHKGWMADFGVTSSQQLFDARTNAEMAYQLYLRAGTAPWNL